MKKGESGIMKILHPESHKRSLGTPVNLILRGTWILLLSLLVLGIIPFTYLYLRFFNFRGGRIAEPIRANQLKVVYLRTDFWFGLKAGGSVTHISGFCKGINELGHSLFFVSNDTLENIDTSYNPTFIIKPPLAGNVLPMTVQILAYNLIFLWNAVKIVRKQMPDIICQRHSLLNISGVLLSNLCRVPFLLEYNSSSFWKRESHHSLRLVPLLKLFENINLLGADKITVVSSVLKEELSGRGTPARKVCVNPNGVDPDLFNPFVDGNTVRSTLNLDGKTVVGFAGIYGPWHGVEFLARTVKEVRKSNREIRFLFIGDDKLKTVVEGIGKEDGSDSSMVFVKAVLHHEIPRYLAACDILASPHVNMADGSRFFGSPVKLFEYMAMGKPIVASGIEQLSDVLHNEVNALLVHPGDVNGIASAILRLSKDPALRKRLGKAARKRCLEAFTWKHNAQRFIDSYYQIS